MSTWRNALEDTKPKLQVLYRKAKNRVTDLVATARANWARKKVEKISKMNLYPGEAWKAAKEVMAGFGATTKKPRS